MADSASPSSTSPTVARWEFARRIKVRRDDLDLRIDAVAKHLGFSRNFYSAVENERSMLAVDKLEPLFDLLEFEDQDRDELRELNEAARRRSELGGLAGDEAGERFIGLEQGASRIRTFESFVWPGLFQLPEYAAAVFGADPRRARAAIDDYVSLRIRRQEKVFGKGTPVQAVVSEAVVMQQWGSRDLQHEQLRHILSLLEHGEVELRVLRFDTVPGMIINCSTLVLLSFESPHLPELSYDESLGGVHVFEDVDPAFEPIRLAWSDGVARALDPEESAQLLSSRLDEA